ncbi:MAG: hypothetical protein ABII12_07415 [Planctomycetota bacterium]
MLLHRRLAGYATLIAVVAGLTLTPSAMADPSTDLLKLVPEDAWGFVYIKSLNNIDQKAAEIKGLFGLEYPTPITPMALAMLNLGDTLDMTRPLCMVIMDVNEYGSMQNPGEAGVLLVPVTDSKAFLEKLTPPAAPEAEGAAAEKKDEDDSPEMKKGVTKIAIMGNPAYAAAKGKYVVLCAKQDCIEKVLESKKSAAEGITEARLAAVGRSDLFVSISLGTIVDAYKDMFLPMLKALTAQTDPEGENIEKFIKMLNEVAAFDLGFRLEEAGVSLSLLFTPKKDSDLEKWLRETKNSDESLLALLPKEKYIFAMGTTGGYSKHSEKFSNPHGLSQMLTTVGIEGLNEEAAKELESEVMDMAKQGGPTAMSISFLPDGKEGMFGVTIVTQPKSSPKEYVDGIRKLYGLLWKMVEGTEEKEPDEDLATFKENIVHTPDAETIGGKKVDTVAVKLAGFADLLSIEEDDLKLIQKVLGKDVVLRFGAADGKNFVITLGGGKDRFEAVCDNLKSGGGLNKDPGIQSVAAHIPSSRSSEGYIALDNLGHAIKAVAKTLGEEAEFNYDIPTVDSPIVFAGAQLGPTTEVKILVTTKLIKAIKAFADKQMNAMMDDFDEDEDEDKGDDEADDDADDDDDDDEDDD